MNTKPFQAGLIGVFIVVLLIDKTLQSRTIALVYS